MSRKKGFLTTKKQQLISELNRLEKRRGVIDPHDVVKLAASERSIFHPYFEWDNNVGGDKYRLIQARLLINNVQVWIMDEHKSQVFLNVKVKNKRGYVSRDVALSDDTMHHQVVRYAALQLRHWQDTYRELTELSGIIDEDILNSVLE